MLRRPFLVPAAGCLLLAGCVSDFELELPEGHPARPEAPGGGPLEVPSPYAVDAGAEDPPATAPEPVQESHGHGDHGATRRAPDDAGPRTALEE